MNVKIASFIKKNHVASLSMQDGDGTWSFNCFYAVHEIGHLIFLSQDDTMHARLMKENAKISGTIARQSRTVAAIQGVQFAGVATISHDKTIRGIYNRRFPFATAIEAELWIVQLDRVKYTSNLIAFGSKISWERTSL
jgi:uncharacterized protein YhbP (UPF0306 family)